MATASKSNPITVLEEPEPPFSVSQALYSILAQHTTRYDVVERWVIYFPQVMLFDARFAFSVTVDRRPCVVKAGMLQSSRNPS